MSSKVSILDVMGDYTSFSTLISVSRCSTCREFEYVFVAILQSSRNLSFYLMKDEMNVTIPIEKKPPFDDFVRINLFNGLQYRP